MAKIEKRFQLLLAEDELELLKKEADSRGISAGELIRLSLKNEISRKNVYDKLNAIEILCNLQPNE